MSTLITVTIEVTDDFGSTRSIRRGDNDPEDETPVPETIGSLVAEAICAVLPDCDDALKCVVQAFREVIPVGEEEAPEPESPAKPTPPPLPPVNGVGFSGRRIP